MYKFLIGVPAESINDTVALGTKYSDVRIIKRKAQHIAISHLQNLDPLPQAINPKPATPDKRLTVVFDFYFQYSRVRDEDNYHLTAKGFLDALVEMGILISDDSLHLKFGGINLLVDKDRPRCEIIIS